jgi:hypothetical protein
VRQTLIVDRVVPWSQYNEYEGQLDGRVDGNAVSCHSIDGGWDEISPGDVLEIDLRLVRRGDVAIVDAATPDALEQVDGIEYLAVGTVTARDGELVQVDSIMALEVDLEINPFPRSAVPDVAVGDRIRVSGTFEADLDPE